MMELICNQVLDSW